MNTDVSQILATLKTDPANPDLLGVLTTLHPGNGAGVDRETLSGALAAARGWHLEHGDVETCVQLIDAELSWTTGAGRSDLLVEKARLLHGELMRWQAALTCLREALESLPGHRSAKELQQQIEAEEAGWEKTVEAHLGKAKGTGNRPAAAPLLATAGELFLKFRPKAAEGESYLRRTLEVDPHHRRADVLLERVLRDGQRHDELMKHLERRIAAAATPDEKAAAEAAAGQLAAQIGREDEALDHYRKALAINPALPRAFHAMIKALTARESWEEVVKVYENALRVAKRGADLPFLLPLATVCWHNLRRLDQAELYFRRVRKASPLHPDVIQFYREYHLERNEIPQLLALLAQAQKAQTDLEARVRFGIEMAEIAERQPRSLEKAIDAWKAVLRLRPGLPDAVAALRRLYTKTEKWNALLELLKDDIEALPADAADAKIERYLEMVPIYRDRLRLDVMVINTYAAVLQLRPDHGEALAALAERYEAQQRWGDLIQIFSRQADAVSDLQRKVALWHRVAGLWAEKFNKHQNAVAVLEKVLQIAPTDEKARATLREIYGKNRAWRPLLHLMARETALLPVERRPAHLVEMARLATERLSDPRLAIAAWNEALALAPSDPDALAALATLYEREKRWPALAEILGRQADLAEERSPPWCALLERQGLLLHERLGASAAALEVLRKVQAGTPDNARVVKVLREIYAQQGDLAQLENLYAERGAWDELCDVLTGLADRASDAAVRTRLLERVAELSNTQLRQPERALKAYEKLLASDPQNREAARAAADLYRTTERWGRLLATYEVLLGPAAEALVQEEAMAILEEARRICEQKLGSKSLAFQWCARAYALAPNDQGVNADLERLGEQGDEWEALLGLYTKRLGLEPEPDERITLLRRCLRMALSRLNRPADVRTFAEQLLALLPNDDEAEAALQQIYTRTESWPELARLLRARQARVPDPALRVEMLFRIARIEEEKMGDAEAAGRSLDEASTIEPGNVRVLRALARVREATGDRPGLERALERQTELLGEDERVPLLLKLARLRETELGNPDGARQAYLRALETDSICAEAVAGLERLTAAGAIPAQMRAQVAERLAPYYELTENYEKWARALEVLVEAATPEEQTPHLELLTDLYAGPLADAGAAYRAALKMLQLDPRSFALRERVMQLAADAGLLQDMVEAVRKLLEATQDPGLRRELLVQIAELEDRRGGDGGTESAYREVLNLDPLHFGAYRALTRMYRDGERWKDLRDLLELRCEHLPEIKDRVEMLAQIAEIDEALLDDREHAISTLRRLLQFDPMDLKAYRALERHLAAEARWRDLDALLALETPIVPAAEAIEIKLRRADLVLTRFEETAQALSLIDEAMHEAPEHPRVRALLERVLDGAEGEERQRAARLLEPLYEAGGQWGRLVAVLDIQREDRPGVAGLDLLVRVAEIQESKLGARPDALTTWRQVLDLDPRSTRALAEVERLATILEQFRDLVDVYQELAVKRDRADVAGAADLLARAARLHLARLGDRPAATRVWRQVLDIDPSNAAIAAPAADALEALYTEAGDFRGLGEVLRAKVEWSQDVRERAGLLLRIAALEEVHLGDATAAVATYRALLDADPDNGEALANLERIFESTGKHRDRLEILGRRLDALSSREERRGLRFRMVAILEREIGDLNEAVSMALAILDESPEDRAALEVLARLYDRKGAHQERLEILERQLAQAATPLERVDVLRATADLLDGPLGRTADAFERWREILAVAPHDAAALAQVERLLDGEEMVLRASAAQCLEPLYEAAGAWEKLARIVQIYIAADEDPRARMAHRLRLAELQEGPLGDPAGAFACYTEAIRDGLGEDQLPALLDRYERLAGSLGADADARVLALYRAIEPDVLADGVRVRVQRVIAARALAAGEGQVAAEYYRKVLDRAPDDVDVLLALEGVFRRADDAASLFDVLGQRAELAAGNADAELPLRLERGALAERLGRTEEAIAAYERVWTLKPGQPEATEALDGLYTRAGAWGELEGLLERRLALGGPTTQAVAIRARLARLELDKLANRDRALEHLGAVLASDPEHGEAIEVLETLLPDRDVQVAAANLLEPVYVRRQAWASLVAIDKLRLEQTEEPAQRLALTQRIARVYEEQIEDLDEAFRWYGRVFTETPTQRAAQEQLLRLAPKLDAWKEVARLVDGYLDGEPGNTDEVLAVVRLAARVHDERLGDRDGARRFYRRYVDALPGDRRALIVYEQALERWEAWQELRDLLDEQAPQLGDAADRLVLLHRSARLSEERLGNRTDAVTTLKAVLEIDPDDAEASAGLERLLPLEGRWAELRDHLAWRLERESNQRDRDALAMQIAELEQRRLENTAAAVDHYGDILARTPGHPAALAALEALIPEADQRPRVAELLEPIYRSAQDWRKLAEILEVRLETLDDASRRVSILREISELMERVGRMDAALEARGRAWLEDVSAPGPLSDLEALATATKRFPRFVEILAAGAEAAGDPDSRANLCAMRARVLEGRLGDGARAIEAWRETLASRSDDRDAYAALERLLQAAGKTAELCETLERHVEIVADAAERRALTKRVAALYEQALGDRERAVASWRAVLELDAADADALDALVRLHSAEADWTSLAEVLQRKLEIEADPQAARALRFALARLHEEKVAEPFEAASQLRAVLDAHPGDGEALAMLDRIFTAEGQHAELVEVLDRRVQGEKNAAERDALAFRAARLVESELADVQGAVERYRELISRSPRHAGARDALWALTRAEETRALAAPVLEPVLRAEREWQPLVDLLELRLGTEDAAGPRVEILAEIANIEEMELREPRRAFDAWARAFHEDPQDAEVTRALERLAGLNDDLAALAAVYDEKRKETYDGDLQRRLAWKLAELYEGRLADPVRAVDCWREVLSVPGDEAEPLGRLEALLRRLGRDAELEEVLVRRAEASPEASAQADVLAALGEVRLGKLGDLDGAVEAFRGALERVPTHAVALGALRALAARPKPEAAVLDILEPLAEARGDHAELVTLCEARLALEDDSAERALWLRRIAELCETRLADPTRALDALGRALKEDPHSPQTADDLERVAAAAGLAIEAARRMEAVLAGLSGAAGAELALRAARLFDAAGVAGGTQHEEAAERLYERVLDGDPENAAALGALESLYRRRGDTQRLADALERRGALELDPDRRTSLYGEAARLHEDRGDVAAAIRAWQVVREGDETSLNAISELARLYEREGRVQDLVAVLEDKARFVDESAQRTAVYLRIGELKAGPLGDKDGAAAAYREALDASPRDPVALAALVAVEEQREDFAALEEALLRQLATRSGAEQVPVLFQLAKNAADRLDDPERALAYLHQVLDADAGNRAAFDDLAKLLTRLERWHELIELLERRIELEAASGQPEAELACRVSIAEIWGSRLGASDNAQEALEAILVRNPGHGPSLLALARIHEAEERWDEALEALGKAATSAVTPRDRAEIHVRTGKIRAAKGAPGPEIEESYFAALQSDPTHLEAITGLEQLARASGNVGQLVQILDLHERVVGDEAQRRVLLSEIAALYMGPLASPAEAVAPLEALARMVPADLGVQENLGRALAAAGRSTDGEAILAKVVEQLSKARRPKDVARLQGLLGQLAEARGDVAAAEQRLAAAYQVDPTQAATLAGLARLALRGNDAEKARRFYRSLLLHSFDEKSVGITKGEIYLNLGKLHVQAGEIAKARNMFERGLEGEPRSEALKAALAGLPRS